MLNQAASGLARLKPTTGVKVKITGRRRHYLGRKLDYFSIALDTIAPLALISPTAKVEAAVEIDSLGVAQNSKCVANVALVESENQIRREIDSARLWLFPYNNNNG